MSNNSNPDHPGEMPGPNNAATMVANTVKWFEDKEKYEKRLKEVARNKTLGMMYLHKVDKKRYGDLWVSLRNNYSRKTEQCPDTLSEAYIMVCAHIREQGDDRNQRNRRQDKRSPELFFLQTEIVSGTDGKTIKNRQFYKCQKYGHLVNKCPETESNKAKTFNAVQLPSDSKPKSSGYHFMFTQVSDYGSIPDT